jgi:hypothetical protein
MKKMGKWDGERTGIDRKRKRKENRARGLKNGK